MRYVKEKSSRLMICALISSAAFVLHASGIVRLDILNPLTFSGCASFQTKVEIPEGIKELPSIDRMLLEKPARTSVLEKATKQIAFVRGDLIVVVFVNAKNEKQGLGRSIFLGLDPAEGTLVSASENGSVFKIQLDRIASISKIRRDKATRVLIGTAAGTAGGAATGAFIGAAAYGTTGAGIGAGCLGAPGLLIGLGVGAIAGIDPEYEIGEGEWRIRKPAEMSAVRRDGVSTTGNWKRIEAGVADGGVEPDSGVGDITN